MRKENEKLSAEVTENICYRVDTEVFEEMREELKQEREKNNDLINFIEGIEELKGINKINELVDIINKYQEDFISKDKIRAKIKELENKYEEMGRYSLLRESITYEIKALKELLEEN